MTSSCKINENLRKFSFSSKLWFSLMCKILYDGEKQNFEKILHVCIHV